MNDDKIKQKLQLLQAVQPDAHLLHTIQKEIEKQTAPKRFDIKKILPFPVYVPFSVIAVVLLLYFVVTTIFSNSVSDIKVQIQLAMAPTQYDRAKIAYEYADKQYQEMKYNSFSTGDISELSHSLTLANSAMLGLTLKGEKGKYTMQQCLALYSSYHEGLEKMNNELGPSKKYLELKTEIEQYDSQAEKRLHSYKK